MLGTSIAGMVFGMSLGYKLLYAIGFTPWEQIGDLPAVTARASALFDLEEAGSEPPYGRARPRLRERDLGGRAGKARLPGHGSRHRPQGPAPRSREEGVEMRLIEGDVTKLRATDVGSGYPLLLDFGLFHDELSDEQRERMGRAVSAVAAPGRDAANGRLGARPPWTAAARREPRRHRGRLPRVGCDR
ncbi:MAG TPA: hypothetical protein VI122_16710 [Thermoleophilaceae bacterium]